MIRVRFEGTTVTLGSRISQDLQVLFSREKRWAREEEKEKEKERGEREREKGEKRSSKVARSPFLFVAGWSSVRFLLVNAMGELSRRNLACSTANKYTPPRITAPLSRVFRRAIFAPFNFDYKSSRVRRVLASSLRDEIAHRDLRSSRRILCLEKSSVAKRRSVISPNYDNRNLEAGFSESERLPSFTLRWFLIAQRCFVRSNRYAMCRFCILLKNILTWRGWWTCWRNFHVTSLLTESISDWLEIVLGKAMLHLHL